MSNGNRIGAACWYQPSIGQKWVGGTLLAWGTDFEELNDQMGPIPVGIIEDDKTKCCYSIYVKRICFASIPPYV